MVQKVSTDRGKRLTQLVCFAEMLRTNSQSEWYYDVAQDHTRTKFFRFFSFHKESYMINKYSNDDNHHITQRSHDTKCIKTEEYKSERCLEWRVSNLSMDYMKKKTPK